MPSLLTTRKRHPLTAAEVNALRRYRMRKRLSLRALAALLDLPLTTVSTVLNGTSETAAARVRALLEEDRHH
jgi:transcriptional regulator with XRE-family HTH domain